MEFKKDENKLGKSGYSYLENSQFLYSDTMGQSSNINQQNFQQQLQDYHNQLNQNNNVLETEPTLILKDNQVINLNNLKDIKNEKEDYKNIDDDLLKIYYDENQIPHVFHPILAY